MMDTSKLNPILNKESILKTANARELKQSPQAVLERYVTYALTHVPLGDTTRQLSNLRRVIVENKTCAVGTIVGPYGYGKTSTAVHLWNELRSQKIMAVPPFLWTNLQELMDAVFEWLRFEFAQGPKTFVPQLENLYGDSRHQYLEELGKKMDPDVMHDLIEKGRLLLEIRPEDVVRFFSGACAICEEAGYQGLAVFTDELQVTIAEYKPSRDQFFNDLFQIVKDVLGLSGHWALVVTMNDDTEGAIARLRADLLQRMQRSALYFRVKDVYNRREYPGELWSAFETRFGFNGSDVMLSETLDSIGQVAARSDLGAGPRMVTHALSLAARNFVKTGNPYTPVQFVDDFLAGQMSFDQRGKFVTAVRKALENAEVKKSEQNQRLVKLLAANPMGCTEGILSRFELQRCFQSFPALARKELILQQSGGYILRYLAEEDTEPEQIEQRLTKEFVARYAPGKSYALRAAEGFVQQVLLEPTFNGWKCERHKDVRIAEAVYRVDTVQGTFDPHFPERKIALLTSALPQSAAPQWDRVIPDVDIELRFELNYSISAGEPSHLLVSPKRPDVAIFQLNLAAFIPDAANKMLSGFLHDYYSVEQLTPLLALALVEHLFKNRGDLPDDRNRVNVVIAPLRQYSLTVLLGDQIDTVPQEFASGMVGIDRIKDLFRQQCRQLYPNYQTLITSSKWLQNLQQYNYALQSVIADDGISIARGRRPWKASKEAIADAFRIPGRRLTSLESLLDTLGDLIVKEEFAGRTASSEVTLKFKLHPLEQDWLGQLDASSEKIRRNKLMVPALPPEQLIRQAKQSGYTDEEVTEVLRLLQTRKFVDLDQRENMLFRAVDAIDDLRDAVQEQINHLDRQVQELAEKIPDFEANRYPVVKLRKALEEAKARDEIENVKAEVRQASSDLSSYAASRLGTLRQQLQDEQSSLLALFKQGTPTWLAREFAPGPLHDLLENQRRDLASAYRSALDDARRLREESVKEFQAIPVAGAEAIIKTYEALQALRRQKQKLASRLQTYDDRREDLEAWHIVSSVAMELSKKADNALKTYGHGEFKTEIDALWSSLMTQFDAQPLTILGAHKLAGKQIETQDKRISEWLNSRRVDFDRQCQDYQKMLAQVMAQTDLKIPFDQENPSESYAALIQTVTNRLVQHLDSLKNKLTNALQAIMYAIQVQELPLADAESCAESALKQVTALTQQVKPEVIGDHKSFEVGILRPIVALQEEEEQIARRVQQTIQQRPAVGTEVALMDQLRSSTSGSQIDLRALILELLGNEKRSVDLDQLMKDLESLFQKNQIALYIELLQRR